MVFSRLKKPSRLRLMDKPIDILIFQVLYKVIRNGNILNVLSSHDDEFFYFICENQ